jgi:hypothetical protein
VGYPGARTGHLAATGAGPALIRTLVAVAGDGLAVYFPARFVAGLGSDGLSIINHSHSQILMVLDMLGP